MPLLLLLVLLDMTLHPKAVDMLLALRRGSFRQKPLLLLLVVLLDMALHLKAVDMLLALLMFLPLLMLADGSAAIAEMWRTCGGRATATRARRKTLSRSRSARSLPTSDPCTVRCRHANRDEQTMRPRTCSCVRKTVIGAGVMSADAMALAQLAQSLSSCLGMPWPSSGCAH
jgi:hypothetical protein